MKVSDIDIGQIFEPVRNRDKGRKLKVAQFVRAGKLDATKAPNESTPVICLVKPVGARQYVDAVTVKAGRLASKEYRRVK